MKRFRLLEPDEIECRVQTCRDNGVSLLLYKTARTDADLLDETVGADRWENDFKVIDGVLYGGIGVNYGTSTVWKWDAGTESNTEAEKGRASDAYKRAGFKHGIGRELYSAPFIWISSDRCTIKLDKKGKPACYDEFVVKHIGYDEQEHINSLVITVKGKTVYSFGAVEDKPITTPTAPQPEIPKTEGPKPEAKSFADMAFLCADCGNVITPYTDKNGKLVGVRRIAETTRNSFGRSLCISCAESATK